MLYENLSVSAFHRIPRVLVVEASSNFEKLESSRSSLGNFSNMAGLLAVNFVE